MWSREKLEKQKEYFREQRINKTGNFTEFVVRTYYSIYKACDKNNMNYCFSKDVSSFKIRYMVYEGIYDGVPDHDYQNVIGNCFTHLNEMGYIHYDQVDHAEIIVIDKPLDFLKPDEHQYYKQKYHISHDIEFNNKIEVKHLSEKDNKETNLQCSMCDGTYLLREGIYGYFYGCSHYPKCKSTLKLPTFMYQQVLKNGLNVYEQKTTCWKCQQEINILSYFLDLDFKLNHVPIPEFSSLNVFRLGSVEEIDLFLMNKYSTIRKRFSKKAGFSYIGNICPFCDNLQGSQMSLGNVHQELLKDLENNHLQDEIKEKIKIDQCISQKEFESIIYELFSYEEERI